MLFKFSSFYILENNYLEQTHSYFPLSSISICLKQLYLLPSTNKQKSCQCTKAHVYIFKSSLTGFFLLLLKVLNLLASSCPHRAPKLPNRVCLLDCRPGPVVSLQTLSSLLNFCIGGNSVPFKWHLKK